MDKNCNNEEIRCSSSAKSLIKKLKRSRLTKKGGTTGLREGLGHGAKLHQNELAKKNSKAVGRFRGWMALPCSAQFPRFCIFLSSVKKEKCRQQKHACKKKQQGRGCQMNRTMKLCLKIQKRYCQNLRI